MLIAHAIVDEIRDMENLVMNSHETVFHENNLPPSRFPSLNSSDLMEMENYGEDWSNSRSSRTIAKTGDIPDMQTRTGNDSHYSEQDGGLVDRN